MTETESIARRLFPTAEEQAEDIATHQVALILAQQYEEIGPSPEARGARRREAVRILARFGLR